MEDSFYSEDLFEYRREIRYERNSLIEGWRDRQSDSEVDNFKTYDSWKLNEDL